MPNRTILKYPNAQLKKKSIPVSDFDDTFKSEVKDLIDTLEVNRGAGLAAPQIGIQKRFLLIKPSAFDVENPDPIEDYPDYMLLVNPVVELSKEKIRWPEACLSVREKPMYVSRAKTTSVQYQTFTGESREITLDWPLSAALQHEYDHLDGVLYIDRIGSLAKSRLVKEQRKRDKVKRQMRLKEKEREILEEKGPAAARKWRMSLSGKNLAKLAEKRRKKKAQIKSSKKKNRKR